MNDKTKSGAAEVAPVTVTARTLIEGCFTATGTAELRYVYDLAVQLGLPEQTVRLAIRRMERAGELRQEGRGRAGQLVLSNRGASLMRTNASLVAFAYAQDAGLSEWDGNWRLYLFNVPESKRAARDTLRSALTQLGAAALAPGSYLTPHELGDELAITVPELLGDNLLTTATLAELSVPECENDLAIAEKFWPAAPIAESYAELEDQLSKIDLKSLHDEIAVAAVALQLSQGLEHALLKDPILPNELRAKPWLPVVVRARFVETWHQLRSMAPKAPIFIEHEKLDF